MHFAIASALAMASSVSGHALMYGVWVNGEDQGDGQKVYIRSPPNNSPVKDLSLSDIVCNVNGATAAPEFVQAAAGDTLTFEWYHNTRNDDIIDGSHKGPIITWIAQYTEDDGSGPIWSKIAEDGFDGSQWAVDKLIANSGKNDFTLPSSLAAGQYLIRQEIIAHHESETTFDVNPARGAQFYPSCVQIEVTGSGSTVPDQGFDFNTDYTYADPGIHFNIYGDFSSYPIPGPEVFSGSGSGSGSSPSSSSAVAASTSAAAPTSAAATSAAATASSPASSGGNEGIPEPSTSAPVAAPTTTLATVISSAPAVPATTETVAAPSTTSTPPVSCSGRRRRRRRSVKKNTKKNAM
ncbi:Fc.00g059140.m01.CDS01 [Cosmosporella sp. VM-42]